MCIDCEINSIDLQALLDYFSGGFFSDTKDMPLSEDEFRWFWAHLTDEEKEAVEDAEFKAFIKSLDDAGIDPTYFKTKWIQDHPVTPSCLPMPSDTAYLLEDGCF